MTRKVEHRMSDLYEYPAALQDALSQLTGRARKYGYALGRCDILSCERDAYIVVTDIVARADVFICDECWSVKAKGNNYR